MFKLLSPIVNAVVKRILRSPLHSPLSKRLLLITFAGRKSGKTYTTPTSYVREGQDIIIFSERNRRWWRNLEGGAPVEVRVQGKARKGSAEPIRPDARLLARDQQSIFQRVRRRISGQTAERIAANRVAIRIRLA